MFAKTDPEFSGASCFIADAGPGIDAETGAVTIAGGEVLGGDGALCTGGSGLVARDVDSVTISGGLLRGGGGGGSAAAIDGWTNAGYPVGASMETVGGFKVLLEGTAKSGGLHRPIVVLCELPGSKNDPDPTRDRYAVARVTRSGEAGPWNYFQTKNSAIAFFSKITRTF